MIEISNIMQTSIRQNPVIDHLADLLDNSKAVAAAISDNAIDEQLPIPVDLLQSFCNDLERIKAYLITAYEVNEGNQSQF
jgi:hypothetical protein